MNPTTLDRSEVSRMKTERRSSQTSQTAWKAVYWTLTASFLLSAALNMLDVRAGFLTSYLADLTVPALLYVISRELGGARPLRYGPLRWIGRTPRRAAAVLFLASTATEVSQVFWPRGVFSGRFDPWDIVAYGVGLLICYVFDRVWEKPPPVAETVPVEGMPPAAAQPRGGQTFGGVGAKMAP